MTYKLSDSTLMQAVEEFGTPLYVFDQNALQRRISFMRENLPRRVRLVFAMKANPFLLPVLEGLVDGFEVCSTGEYRICQDSKVDLSKLIISGVNKDVDLVDELVADYPGCTFTAESPLQFQQILEAAHRHQTRVAVLLRLTSANQFGMDASDVRAIIAQYKDDAFVDIRGIHYFSGTQKTAKRVCRELGKLDKFLASLQEDYGFVCQELEYGPGFPVAYFEGEEVDDQAIFDEVSAAVDAMEFAGAITFEHGRFIAAPCGTYITKVADAKSSKGQNYAIVDGGMHQLVYYGHSMAMRQPECRLLNGDESQEAQEWNICGSLCTANDILAKQLTFSGLDVGSLLAFEKAGAYCMMEGPILLLSRDIPAIVLHKEDGAFDVVRAGRQMHDFNTFV